jgi:shikimate dehydrogenase
MNHYGLIGRNISYSFSPAYFLQKFSSLKTAATYDLFDIEHLDLLQGIVHEKKLSGFNITIPYKETILPYLAEVSNEVQEIGAVNTVVVKNKQLIGYNTDWIGCREALSPFLKKHHRNALVLGTGGSAKAVTYALHQLGISSKQVSRSNGFTYSNLKEMDMQNFQVVINCTPLGSMTHLNEYTPIPFEYATPKHIFFDLIYNPEQTIFLKKAAQFGAITLNGLVMLKKQADAAWEIWKANG